MGNSGNSHGAHVHLNCIAVDKNGYRQKNYGMNGRIDPLLPLLALFGSPVNISGVPWYTYVEDNPEFRGFM